MILSPNCLLSVSLIQEVSLFQANRIQGVHTWNLAGNLGGVGIVLHNGAGRVQDAYLDCARATPNYAARARS